RDASTRGARDELLNTNRVLADVARIGPDARVLDAGCGVGGSAVWLARHTGARVLGLTLSPRQARHARAFARHHDVARQVEIGVRDYLHTHLPDRSFDVVWALESSCYAADKRAFLREAFRLLAPGGRLVLGDGFLLRAPRTARERRECALFC